MSASIHLAIGHSDQPDPLESARSIVEQAEKGRAGRPARAAVLFSGFEQLHDGVLDALEAAYPGIPLLGCSSCGEFSSAISYQEDSTVLGLFCGDGWTFGAGRAIGLSRDLEGTVRAAVVQALCQLGCQPRLCLAFSDGFGASGEHVLRSLTAALGPQVAVVGGNAADDWNFKQSWQFFGREKGQDTLVVLLIGGEFSFGHGVAYGWSPISRPARVTRSFENRVVSLDGKPALSYYRHYLGEHSRPSGEFPLLVNHMGEQYLRAPMRLQPEDGAIEFSGDVPEGAMVQMTDATKEAVLAAARDSARQALERLQGQPLMGLGISCGARRQILGSMTHLEYEGVAEELASPQISELSMLGFYSYGEFCPLESGKPARFHNESFVTLLFGTP